MPMKALLQPLEAVAGFDDLKKQLKKELGIVWESFRSMAVWIRRRRILRLPLRREEQRFWSRRMSGRPGSCMRT